MTGPCAAVRAWLPAALLALTAAAPAAGQPAGQAARRCYEKVTIHVTVPKPSASSNGPREAAWLSYSARSCGHPVRALLRCAYRGSHGGPAARRWFHGRPSIRRPGDGKSRTRCTSSVNLVDADWAGYQFRSGGRWHRVKLLPASARRGAAP